MHSVCLWNDFNTMESVKYDDYINYPHLEKTYSNNLKTVESKKSWTTQQSAMGPQIFKNFKNRTNLNRRNKNAYFGIKF